uniref:Uncharacterized protein n=1 Tax=Arundo donax TaxID=35708 RepID=A0A0A8YT72_ARUDO
MCSQPKVREIRGTRKYSAISMK